MTLLHLLRFIYEERRHDLDDWEREFVSDLYHGMEGVVPDLTDEDIGDYLTRRQISKLREIGEDLGL